MSANNSEMADGVKEVKNDGYCKKIILNLDRIYITMFNRTFMRLKFLIL